jgi:hypothetical protein
MPANRMKRDEFYAAMAPHDQERLRTVLWTLYWRGNAQLRERIEDELRPQEQPKVSPKKEPPDPDAVLNEVTTFVELAEAGAYMAGDRRVHHTERSKWRHTFRRLVADALAALQADDPAPAQRAVGKIVDLACDMRRYDYFHSDDPVEAAKFVVSDAVAVLWESVLRHNGPAAFASRVPEQLIRWEANYGWTRRGYGQVAEKETRYRRCERADDLAVWHEMLLEQFAGTPEDDLLDRLVASPALAGPGLAFLRAKIAARRGDVAQAAVLVTESLKELPGRTEYQDFAVEVGAELPPRARKVVAERARI